MKPPVFDYVIARSAEDAVRHLSAIPGAMVLAGGQSLIPAMNFRLAAPAALVDINRIAELSRIDIADGNVTVGATVRHRDLEQSEEAQRANPLLRAALAHVAHVPIRNRGTTVGSLCHGDAAAEMPLMLLLTDGWVTALGPSGERRIDAGDFFQFHMTTTREPDELIVSATFGGLPAGAGWGFAEYARRKGDYAIAAVGAIVRPGAGGMAESVSLAACGIASRPVRLGAAEAVLAGTRLEAADIDRAAEAAAEAVTAPDDANATTVYRRHLLSSLLRRVVAEARDRAGKE